MPTKHLLTSLLILAWLTALPNLALSQADEVTSTPTVETESPVLTPIETATQFTPEMFTGIYTTKQRNSDPSPPWILSVHVKGNSVIAVDISGHWDFLEAIGYLSEEEANNGLQVSAYDRAFQGEISPLQSEAVSNLFIGTLNPILPMQDRASTHWEVFNLFLNISFYVSFKPNSGEPIYQMDLSRRGAIFTLGFPLGGYVKIF